MSTKLTNKSSIEMILKEMTVEEKALLLTGKTTFSSRDMERFDIPSIMYLDCASGINLMQYFMEVINKLKDNTLTVREEKNDGNMGSLLAMMGDAAVVYELTDNFFNPEKLSEEAKKIYDYLYENIIPNKKLPSAFPDGMALGASWNPELVKKVGEAVGIEAAAYRVDILLGSPNVNIHRDPLNGRLFEGFSDDPCLVSKLAPELVKGVQEQGIGADVKHYAANNQETLRQGINELISERALREIYFPGFKACAQDGKAMTIMSAYNKINGVECAHNKWLLTDVLKNEWGFDGFVVSDWGAVYVQAEAFAAGNDVDMPGPRDIRPIIQAIENGTLQESALDDSIRRFLSAIVDLKEMRLTRKKDFDRDFSKTAAYEMAAESMVLLKNEGKLLPLKKSSKVSFYGEKSKKFLPSGEGSALVITDQTTSLYDETAGYVGAGNVDFEEIKSDTDVVVITASLTSSEGVDHFDMELAASEKKMVMDAVNKAKKADKKVVLILNSGGPVETQDFIDDVDAMIWVFYPGMEGGRAAADILFGGINPSGKLPLTYPKRYKDCPTYGNFPGEGSEVWYGEGIYVGYRYYDKKDVEPLFPFGHGLSYTDFEISNLKLESDTWNKDKKDCMNVSLTVKNTGSIKGKEVIQLYLAQENSSLPKPLKELKAFRKVELAPGEEEEISFKLMLADLESYNEDFKQWDCEPGIYHVLSGNSSRNITCDESFRLVGHSIYDFGPKTQMIKILGEQKATAVIEKHLDGVVDTKEFFGSFGFMPYLSFELAWNQVAAINMKKEIADDLYGRICKDLKDILL